jgi:hypothetical protein
MARGQQIVAKTGRRRFRADTVKVCNPSGVLKPLNALIGVDRAVLSGRGPWLRTTQSLETTASGRWREPTDRREIGDALFRR